MTQKMELVIDYCTDSGHLDKAVETAREVLTEYPETFEVVELVPSDNGVLRVSIESEIIFDLEEDEFSVEKIEERVENHLEEQEDGE